MTEQYVQQMQVKVDRLSNPTFMSETVFGHLAELESFKLGLEANKFRVNLTTDETQRVLGYVKAAIDYLAGYGFKV